MHHATRPGPAYERAFDSEVGGALFDALNRAYLAACEKHDPHEGSNEQTFGYSIYHFAVFRLLQLARSEASRLRVLSVTPSFRFGVDDFEVACHRVGSSEHQSIWESFPNGENAAHTMLEESLWLPGMGPSRALDDARKLVLAHLGNHEDGLRALYLCAPGKTKGTEITQWAFAEPLFVAGAITVAANDATDLVPIEETAEVVVKRKVRRIENEQGG